MSKYARIINNTAIDVVESDPRLLFHPTIAADFISVPDEVKNNSKLVEGVWVAPPETPIPEPVQESIDPPVSNDIKVSPPEFKLLFTVQERVAIKEARATNPIVDDFYNIVEDPRLTHVNLSLQSTKDALLYLTSLGLITEDRRLIILSGTVT